MKTNISDTRNQSTIGEILKGQKYATYINPDYQPKSPSFIYMRSGAGAKSALNPTILMPVIFELTDDEAIEIVNKKIEIMREHNSVLLFDEPFVLRPEAELSGDKGLRAGVDVVFNIRKPENKVRNRTFYTQMTLYTFSGNMTIGAKTRMDDQNLRYLIAQKLAQKYGEPYKIAYSRFWIGRFEKLAQKGKLEKSTAALNTHLADIGKQLPKDYVLGGGGYLDYAQLQNLSTDGEAE